MNTPAGRQDQLKPLFSAKEKLGWSAVLMLVWLGVSWHLAVTWWTPVELGQPDLTYDALSAMHPVSDLPGSAGLTPLVITAVVVWCAGGAAVFTAAWFVSTRFRRRKTPKGMAGRAEVKAIAGLDTARQRAQYDRPSLAEGDAWKRADVEDVGFLLGKDAATGEEVVIPYGKHIAVLGPTGSKKTSSVVIPVGMAWPGPLVLTANEVSVIDAIYERRSALGHVYVFDPGNRVGWPDEMTWDMVNGSSDPDRAEERAGGFADGCVIGLDSTTNGSFFRGTATTGLKGFLHAAALGGRNADDVLRWTSRLNVGGHEEASALIRRAALDDPTVAEHWADGLDDVATGGDATVASTRQTLSQMVDPLRLPAVLKWVSPRAGVPNFDADAFVRSTDTLVLVSDSSSKTKTAALTTMLFADVVSAVKRYTPFLDSGMIDPPLGILGEEIANVAPIKELPELTTELRKHGVQIILVLQSLAQVQERWGEHGADVLLGQMGAEVVLSGLRDPKALERYTTLIDTVDVVERAVTFDATGQPTSHNVQVNERKAMRAGEIRKIKENQGLLVMGNASPILVELIPYWDRPYAEEVRRSKARNKARRIAHRQAQVSR